MAQIVFKTEDEKMKHEEKLFREIDRESYFKKFESTKGDNIVHVKTELEKGLGSKLTFGIRHSLIGEGVKGDEILENKEENLTTSSMVVELEQYRHAVRDTGRKANKGAYFSISDNANDALREWGINKIDKLKFDAILNDPRTVVYPDSTGAIKVVSSISAATSDLHATNSKPTSNIVSLVKVLAKTGGNKQIWKIKPIVIKGKRYFVVLTHPDMVETLRKDDKIYNANKDAMERGLDNPLFNDAEIIYGGVVVHSHEDMPIGVTNSVPWARSKVMGAQALCHAWGRRPEFITKKFDFDNQTAWAWDMMAKTEKTVFKMKNGNIRDYGSFDLVTSRDKYSDVI